MKAKVYLVGAGPGDVKLITLKGLECLKKAGVIIYDHLVNPRLLSYASPSAELIYVGKQADKHTLNQEEINHLLVDKAREDKLVVRLKGGDPFIFGRGGEEAEFLAQNEIPFEVVPGISSAYAVPAYAGIPITHRAKSSTVAFVTGHEDPSKTSSDIDWGGLATGVSTLVFLMSTSNLGFVVEQLIEHGRSKDTPVAVIRQGTTAQQQTLIGTLDTIATKVQQMNLSPPTIIVVGEVVKLREKLSWFDNKPLFGKHILVTSPPGSPLVDILEDLGAEAIESPAIEVVPLRDYGKLDKALKRLSHCDWLIFTSANGVRHFATRLNERDIQTLKRVKICAIGIQTANELLNRGLKVDLIPSQYSTGGILGEFRNLDPRGKYILLPRSQQASPKLAEELRGMGAKVEAIPVYQIVPPSQSRETLEELLHQKGTDMITFTSSSAVRNFATTLKMLGYQNNLEGISVACIGAVTAQAAAEAGFKLEVVAKEYTFEGLAQAIKDYYEVKRIRET
jgi:uroporphyrinogen III methyltransferase/synthase